MQTITSATANHHPLVQNRYVSIQIGKNVVQASSGKMIENGHIDFDTVLQVNADQSALSTQRVTMSVLSVR